MLGQVNPKHVPIFLAKTGPNTSEMWEGLAKGLSKTTFLIPEVPKEHFVGVTNNKHWTFAPKVLSDLCSYHSTISRDRIKTETPFTQIHSHSPVNWFFFFQKKILFLVKSTKMLSPLLMKVFYALLPTPWYLYFTTSTLPSYSLADHKAMAM